MQKLRQFCFLMLVSVLSVVLCVNAVYAQTTTAAGVSSLSCSADGTASGQLLLITALGDTCKADGTPQRATFFSGVVPIFSTLICKFVMILNEVLGTVYCGMQSALLPTLATVLVLYVAVFGAQILMGAVRLSGGEVVLRLLKLSLVWMFASNAAWGIGMIYNFFVSATFQSIKWVLSLTACADDGTGTVYNSPWCMNDINFFLSGIVDTTPTLDVTLQTMDGTLIDVTRNLLGVSVGASGLDTVAAGGNAPLLAFFLMLSYICPPIFFIVLSIVWFTISCFVRTVVGLLLGLTVVAFLVTLSPIFLCFALFKATTHLFDGWLSHLISYSLQPVITFTCFALWLLVSANFVTFSSQLSNVLVMTIKGHESGSVLTPMDTVGVCPLKYSTTVDGGPKIECASDSDKTDPKKLIAPALMIKDNKFIYFLCYHLMTLLVIGFAFASLLRNAPSIARDLAGSSSVMPLGGGFGSEAMSSVGGMMQGGINKAVRNTNASNFVQRVRSLAGTRSQ